MRRGAWLLVFVSLTACATAERRPAPALPPQAREFLAELVARWRGFEDLQGIVELTLEHRERIQRYTGPLFLKAPRALRFEALSPLGQPLLVVAMDGERFTLYSLVEDRAVVGPATERAMSRWLDLPLPPATLVALLAGFVLPLPEIEGGVLIQDGHEARLDLEEHGRVGQRIWFDPQERWVRRVEWEASGMGFQVTLNRDQSMALTVPDRMITLHIRYYERTLGVGLPLARFRVELPEGTSITRIP